MKNFCLILIATLVLSRNSASAPTDNILLDKPVQSAETPKGSNKAEKDLSTVSISTAEPNADHDNAKNYFYQYNQSLSTRLGAGYYFLLPKDPPGDDDKLVYLFGIQYMLKSMTHRHLEFGVDLLSQSRAYLHAGYRWILNPNDFFRKHLKLGFSQRWDRGDSLESLVDYESYQIRGTIGFEYLVIDPASVRVDLDVQAGFADISALLSVGYSWGW